MMNIEHKFKTIIEEFVPDQIELYCESLNELRKDSSEDELVIKLIHLISTASENRSDLINVSLILDRLELADIISEICEINIDIMEDKEKLSDNMHNIVYDLVQTIYIDIRETESGEELEELLFDIIKINCSNFVYKAELYDLWSNISNMNTIKEAKDEYVSERINDIDVLSSINAMDIHDESTYIGNMTFIKPDKEDPIDSVTEEELEEIDEEAVKALREANTDISLVDAIEKYSESMIELHKLQNDFNDSIRNTKEVNGIKKIKIRFSDYDKMHLTFIDVFAASMITALTSRYMGNK